MSDPHAIHEPEAAIPLDRAQPRQRRIIAWKQGAQMLADGAGIGAVAAALGIGEDRLWLHLQRSARFAFHLAQAIDRNRLLAQLRLRSAGAKLLVEAALREPGSDTERLKWLCDACGIVDPAVAAAPDGPDEMVRRLRDTGRRRRRLARAAAGSGKRGTDANKRSAEPNKPDPDSNKLNPDSNKLNPDSNKAVADPDRALDGIDLSDSIPAFAAETVSPAPSPW